ncbi:hypothetical protein Hanom_Chr05g00399471 [Helianthus anomalus]
MSYCLLFVWLVELSGSCLTGGFDKTILYMWQPCMFSRVEKYYSELCRLSSLSGVLFFDLLLVFVFYSKNLMSSLVSSRLVSSRLVTCLNSCLSVLGFHYRNLTFDLFIYVVVYKTMLQVIRVIFCVV